MKLAYHIRRVFPTAMIYTMPLTSYAISKDKKLFWYLEMCIFGYKTTTIMKGEIRYLDYQTSIDFLLPKHYSGRKPVISLSFGWFINNELVAVCTFGKPANNRLCDGICGKRFAKDVYELNRLCRIDDLTEQLSQFVSACLRRISNTEKWIIVSYSDCGMNHNGYIYQACNFIFTGQTKQRLEFYVKDAHSRHGNKNNGLRKIRTAKNRYVYFAGDKRSVSQWKKSFNYPILPYPKSENINYILGQYQQPIIVKYDIPH